MKLTITPQMAKDWLEKSEANYRRLDKKRIYRYSQSMREGRWFYNGESIKLNCDGSVVDGQHRLHAVVQTGISIVSEVVEGITSIDDIDTGKPRQLSDVLRAKGNVNCMALASALRILYEYSNNRTLEGVHSVATTSLLAFLDTCPSLVQSVAYIESNRHAFFRGGWASMLHYCTTRSNPELARRFFDELKSGENLSETDPTFVLREYLITSSTLPGHRRPDHIQKIALGIKAWNSYAIDRPIRVLSYRRTGQTKESFPRVYGFEDFTPE